MAEKKETAKETKTSTGKEKKDASKYLDGMSGEAAKSLKGRGSKLDDALSSMGAKNTKGVKKRTYA